MPGRRKTVSLAGELLERHLLASRPSLSPDWHGATSYAAGRPGAASPECSAGRLEASLIPMSSSKSGWAAPYFLKVYRLRGSTLALEDRFSDTLEHEPEVNGSREMLH